MKQLLKRSTSLAVSLVLTLSALAVWTPGKALAATRTWDGGGPDNKWSTAANWSSDTAPVNGDIVVFPESAPENSVEMENDINNLSLAGMSFTGTDRSYVVSGNGITLTGDILFENDSSLEINITLGANVTIESKSAFAAIGAYGEVTYTLDIGAYNLTVLADGVGENLELLSKISGSGTITKNGSSGSLFGLRDGNSFTGNFIANGGIVYAGFPTSFGTAAGSATFNDGATLHICPEGSPTFNENFIFNGGPRGGGHAKIEIGSCGGSANNKTVTFAGSVTLGANVTVASSSGNNGLTLKITGPLSGDYTIEVTDGQGVVLDVQSSDNTSKTPNGTQESKAVEKVYDEDNPSLHISVPSNQIAVVTGTYGSVAVSGDGILKGTGTMRSVTASHTAVIAPGMSPGRLTVLEYLLLYEGTTYEVELLNKDEYDQLAVGENYASGSSAITLNNATLEASILEGFRIGTGDEFTIINNLSDTDVSGTFKDLPEGATFKISDGVFKITYVGGDGNDVVLSVVSVPTVPSTGFKLSFASPAVILVAAVTAAGAVFYLTRRFSLARLGAKS